MDSGPIMGRCREILLMLSPLHTCVILINLFESLYFIHAPVGAILMYIIIT